MIDKIQIPKIEPEEIKDQFYTVLSVELGNTTIKSIIITTNIKTNKIYQLNKLVWLTRDIPATQDSGDIFGKTIWGKNLSQKTITKTISKIITESLKQVNLTVEDIDFVVRSTGIVAVKELNNNLDIIIKALSEGCLISGIKPSQMTAPFSLNNIPEHIRKYSFFNTIQFDGSVVSIKPTTGESTVSNQMESELVTAGIKLAARNSTIDYRNPILSIDMGTTLAGELTDNKKPYANVKCNYIGLAGAISDILLRSTGIINQDKSTIDIGNIQPPGTYDENTLNMNTKKIHKHINVETVDKKAAEYAMTGINTTKYQNSDMTIIGSKIKDEKKLTDTFQKVTSDNTINEILLQIDDINAYLIKRIIDKTDTPGMIDEETTLGITGRAGTTGLKPEFIKNYLEDRFTDIVFIPDGLALGALMMARCMNSLGTPLMPVGGSKNGMCIMQDRIKYHKK